MTRLGKWARVAAIATLALLPFASAQIAQGPNVSAALAAMNPQDRANASALLTACADHFTRLGQLEAGRPEWSGRSADAIVDYYASNQRFSSVAFVRDISTLEAMANDTRQVISHGGWLPIDATKLDIDLCLRNARIAQIRDGGVKATGTAASQWLQMVRRDPDYRFVGSEPYPQMEADLQYMANRCDSQITGMAKADPTRWASSLQSPVSDKQMMWGTTDESFLIADIWQNVRNGTMTKQEYVDVMTSFRHQLEEDVRRSPDPVYVAISAARICFREAGFQRLGIQTSNTPASPAAPQKPAPAATPAPAPAPAAVASNAGAYGPRARAALDSVLAPGAPKAKPNAPKLDYSAVADGGPITEQTKKDDDAARQAFDKTKQRKLHNRENDATDCVRVEPTGVRQEWGMEGRYRIVNTCGYPIEASWCANSEECGAGRGNTWKIPANGKWPIFFADPTNPEIGVGACRTGAQAKPLPSDAAIAAAGGVNTSHLQPAPQPGVGAMQNHRCE